MNKVVRPAEALKLLVEGNSRFSKGLRSIDHFANHSTLKQLAEEGQSPFAIVLTCSDSRVPTETIFDRGFGDLFVVRVAGNVIDSVGLGSIEFAAASFGTPLCLVMGHSQCGAVKAAISVETEGIDVASSHLLEIVDRVRPAVRFARENQHHEGEALLGNATIENVRRTVGQIQSQSKILSGFIRLEKFLVLGAVYDLHTGKVEFDLPQKSPLLSGEPAMTS